MGNLINEILNAPVDSPLIMVLSVAYAIALSIGIYDVRLIQAKTRGFASEVAEEAGGRSLPPWAGYAHLAGWVLIVVIAILNWKYAIALCAAMFLLKVVPVLERIGALIMSSHLQSEIDQMGDELAQLEDSINRKETELVDTKIEVEREIYSLKPECKPEEFVPPFYLWSQYPEIQELDIEEAMDYYIDRFQLLPSDRDEPDDLAKRRVKCAILEETLQHVESPIREPLREHLLKSQNLLAFLEK